MATARARGIIRMEIAGLKGQPQMLRNVVDNGGWHVMQIHEIPEALERFEKQYKTCLVVSFRVSEVAWASSSDVGI